MCHLHVTLVHRADERFKVRETRCRYKAALNAIECRTTTDNKPSHTRLMDSVVIRALSGIETESEICMQIASPNSDAQLTLRMHISLVATPHPSGQGKRREPRMAASPQAAAATGCNSPGASSRVQCDLFMNTNSFTLNSSVTRSLQLLKAIYMHSQSSHPLVPHKKKY